MIEQTNVVFATIKLLVSVKCLLFLDNISEISLDKNFRSSNAEREIPSFSTDLLRLCFIRITYNTQENCLTDFTVLTQATAGRKSACIHTN